MRSISLLPSLPPGPSNPSRIEHCPDFALFTSPSPPPPASALDKQPRPGEKDYVKKTFPLSAPNHQPPRVIAAIKNDVRKYLKRERRKTLPEGAQYWQFDCKVGYGEAAPEVKKASELIAAIDLGAERECATIYIEIVASPGVRAAGGEQVNSEQ